MKQKTPNLPPPPVAAAGVVALDGNSVLLVRRDKDPAREQWSFPGGSIHPGERTADAARREAEEETGLRLRILDVIGIYDGIYSGSGQQPGFHYCVANFLATAEDGREPRAQSNVSDARWVPLDQTDCYTISDAMRTTLAHAVELHRQLTDSGARRAVRVEGLYVITGEHREQRRSHLDVTRGAVAGGARLVQLREKHRDTGELVRIA